MSGGGSGGGNNTVNTVQQIPEYQQAESQANESLANSLASTPYPQYQGQLIAGLTPAQQAGQGMAVQQAFSYGPAVNAGLGSVGQAQSLTAPGSAMGYMNPYIQAQLAPSIQQLGIQTGQQQNAINAQASQSGAFGDSRQGAAQALQNLYSNQALNQLEGNAYSNAFGAANQALGQAQQTNLQAGQLYGQLGSLQQQLGLQGAGAVYNVGQQQQQQQQLELNSSYQQYLNSVNWPYQMLNVREGAIANSPYNIQTATTLPAGNTAAQGFGTLASVAGLLGGQQKA